MPISSLIKYPFPIRINPFSDKLESLAGQWISEYKSLPENLRNKLTRARYGILTARFWPDAGMVQLLPLCRWMLWIFVYDDFYGPRPAKELRAINARTLDVLNGAPLVPGDNDIMRQAACFMQELKRLPYVPKAWTDRFILHHAWYFQSLVTDTQHYSYKGETSYPTIAEYIPLKERISGTIQICDLTEIAAAYILPDELANSTMVRRIIQLACYLLCWSNDIDAVEHELRRGEAMNIVLVIQHERGCTLDEAYKEAVAMHDAWLHEYIRLSRWWQGHQLEKYTGQLALAIQGLHIWTLHFTNRYREA